MHLIDDLIDHAINQDLACFLNYQLQYDLSMNSELK